MVTAAGKMALVWIAWGAGVVLAFYAFIWLALANYVLEGLLVLIPWILLSGLLAHHKFSQLFDKSQGLPKGKSEDWILLVTVLAAAFATGAALQNVSTIGSEMISRSSCVSPTSVNVTSTNCTQIQTITQAQGPFLYMGQIGVCTVTLGALGALIFGAIYAVIRLMPLPNEPR
jgi:hypothetical protein